MRTFLWVALIIWPAVSFLAGVAVGKAIALADRREGRHHRG